MEHISILGASTSELERLFQSTLHDSHRKPRTLLLVACSLLAASLRNSGLDCRAVLFAFRNGPYDPAIKLLDFLDGEGNPLDHEQLDECFRSRSGPPIMIELLCRGAMDLIDPDVVPVTPAGNHLVATLSVDGARQVSIGVKNFDQRPTTSRIKELIEAEPSEPTAAAIPELITRSSLSRLKPGELARRYDRWKEASVENVEPLLQLASAILLKAGDENVPERPCALVSFEFDGDSEATKVCIIGIEDHLGRHIDAWSILIDWKPDLERDVGWFLAEAVSRYLNRQAPEWNEAPGAGGYINLSISWNAAGELQAEVSGRVRIWTRTERRLDPPSR